MSGPGSTTIRATTLDERDHVSHLRIVGGDEDRPRPWHWLDAAVGPPVAAAARVHDRARRTSSSAGYGGRCRPPVRRLPRDVVELHALRRRRHHRGRAARDRRSPEGANALHAGRPGALGLPVRRDGVRREQDGYGSARGFRADWVVRPTQAGRVAVQLGDRCRSRSSGAGRTGSARAVGELLWTRCGRSSRRVNAELPEYLPIVGSPNGMIAQVASRGPGAAAGDHLAALLSRCCSPTRSTSNNAPSCRCR